MSTSERATIELCGTLRFAAENNGSPCLSLFLSSSQFLFIFVSLFRRFFPKRSALLFRIMSVRARSRLFFTMQIPINVCIKDFGIYILRENYD